MTHADLDHLALNEPVLGEPELEAVRQAVLGGFISTAGPLVAEFESAIADWAGCRYAVATMNGTSALHLAFLALGVGRDDLVAVSDLTFVASANAAAYTGADLLLVDAEADTWNLDGERLLEEIRRRAARGLPLPAAIEPVHILGHPARWEPFAAIVDEFDIPIVEDASEALGAQVATTGGPMKIGTLGDVGCLSFNGNKILTTGGGGMVLTDNAVLAERIRHLSTQAKVAGEDYLHDEIGFNYRMPALLAAVGLAQLGRLDGFVTAKHRIRSWYEARLDELPGVSLQPVADWAEPSHWLISILLEPEVVDEALAALSAANIGARRIWRPMHHQRPFTSSDRVGGDVAEWLYARGVSLPSSPDLCEDDVERVCQVLRDVLGPVTAGHRGSER